MQLEQFKTKEGKRFILALVLIFAVALALVEHAVSQDFPFDTGSLLMLIMQATKVLVYSIVFTLLSAIPLRLILLGSVREP